MRSLAVSLLLLPLLATRVAGDDGDLLAPVKARIAEARAAADSAPDPLSLARALLALGDHDEAARLVPQLRRGDVPARLLAAQALLAVQEFAPVDTLVRELLAAEPGRSDVRALAYRWWTITDDLARVDSTYRAREGAGDLTFADRQATGELALLMLDFGRADSLFQVARAAARSPEEEARALSGLGRTANLLLHHDAALAYLTQAVKLSAPDPELLIALCDVLIRLGRTEDAIGAAELAVHIGPYHERAHYLLGNGYARRNYTQLKAAFPEAFAAGDDAERLREADARLTQGRLDEARHACLDLVGQNPSLAEAWVRLGSLDFAERRYGEAREHFRRALVACPEYGRAHNGLAKALEAQRLEIEVHRAAYEARFEATPMPRVPGLETFVLNWNALTPRLQKSVALSVAPWERFLPVLLEGGLTYYIKPLYEILSETPGQELMRDQRINYDSRLWDDVRGCGGYHTVTGIEDVERTVLGRYNTVLHELTHQVHGVLPAERQREIQERYRQAKARDEAGGRGFLSRYAGGSVWEYFAEGANALYSPRRDRYDTRDVVRERLEKRDPALRDLVREIMDEADVDSCYAVAYVGRGDEELQRGRAKTAVAAYEKALARSPQEESAHAALIYALCADNRARDAVARAEAGRQAQPASARILVQDADALWHAGRGLVTAIQVLEAGRGGTHEEERYLVDLALGNLKWVQGDTAGARAAYRSVLEYQADNPEGLWGLAATAALSGAWDEAWRLYGDAVRLRTGVVDLRADFARDLLRAGRREEARKQVEEATLLDPEDPRILTLRAWLEFDAGDAEAALKTCERALELGPWCDFARVVKAKAEIARGDPGDAARTLAPLRERLAKNAPPEYAYRPKWGRYDAVHTLPTVERALIPETR